ncbi:MAG: hypothetical protein JZD41_08035, partial [Thermoproteus sp.]|nr:hypothetical protein [Thermoproteus sp.]
MAQSARRVCPGRRVADLGAQPLILSCMPKALLKATVKRPSNIRPLRVAAYPLAKTAPSLRMPMVLIERKTQRECKA